MPPKSEESLEPMGAYSGPETIQSSRNWVGLVHGLGIFGPIGPLAVWLLHRRTFSEVNIEGVEALNFQVQAALLEIIVAALSLFFIGGLLVAVVWAYRVAMCLWAGVDGRINGTFRYPGLATRWLKAPLKSA